MVLALYIIVSATIAAVLLAVAVKSWNRQKQQRESYAQMESRQQDNAQAKMDLICKNISAEMSRLGLGEWPYNIHEDPEQIARKKRAYNSKNIKIISADQDKKAYEVMGDQGIVYDIADGRCSYPDFCGRLKSCKHMYFVEMELGHGLNE